MSDSIEADQHVIENNAAPSNEQSKAYDSKKTSENVSLDTEIINKLVNEKSEKFSEENQACCDLPVKNYEIQNHESAEKQINAEVKNNTETNSDNIPFKKVESTSENLITTQLEKVIVLNLNNSKNKILYCIFLRCPVNKKGNKQY